MTIKNLNLILVILILSIIIFPTIYKVYETHHDNLYRVMEQKIIENAHLCYNNQDCINTTITLDELYKNNYLEVVINPINKEVLNPDTSINIDTNEITYIN